MSCNFKGEQCAKCCQAIHIGSKYKFKGLYGTNKIEYEGVEVEADNYFVAQNWKPMSTRLAKKINPYIFKGFKSKKVKRALKFYKCKHLTPKGCGVYNERPAVCRSFPNTLVHDTKRAPNYSANCLPELMIPIKVIDL